MKTTKTIKAKAMRKKQLHLKVINASKFKGIHKYWLKYFCETLKSFEPSFTKKAAKSIFYDYEMKNFSARHIENTEYKDRNNFQLVDSFKSDLNYCSDRMNYDRLFRCHWLFLRAFENEINKVKYPSLYND